MRSHLVATVALAALLPCAALAQTGTAGTGPATQTSAPTMRSDAGTAQQGSAAKLASMSKVTHDLQNAGFTDVQVVAEAFVVRAKTKDGDPVVMTMGPHGFTAFETLAADGASRPMTGVQAGGQAVSVKRLTGMKLYDGQGNTLGEVEHVVASGQGGDSIVIGHGGFLGLGEKMVALPLANVVMRGDRLVTHDLTNDQIKAMPGWQRGQQADLDGARTVQVQQGS